MTYTDGTGDLMANTIVTDFRYQHADSKEPKQLYTTLKEAAKSGSVKRDGLTVAFWSDYTKEWSPTMHTHPAECETLVDFNRANCC